MFLWINRYICIAGVHCARRMFFGIKKRYACRTIGNLGNFHNVHDVGMMVLTLGVGCCLCVCVHGLS